MRGVDICRVCRIAARGKKHQRCHTCRRTVCRACIRQGRHLEDEGRVYCSEECLAEDMAERTRLALRTPRTMPFLVTHKTAIDFSRLEQRVLRFAGSAHDFAERARQLALSEILKP